MHVIYYIEVNLMCIVVLGLFMKQFRYKDEQLSSSRVIFLGLTWSAIVFCLSDLLAGVFRGATFSHAQLLLHLANLIYYEALAVIAFLWLVYVLVQLEKDIVANRRMLFLASLPLLVFTAVALANPWTGFLFSFDENNLYVRGSGVVFHWVITWAYMLVATLMTGCALLHEKSRLKRQQIYPLLNFIVAPTIASVVQMLFYGVTSTQLGVTTSLVMIALANQSSQVLTDTLTGLSNRRGLDNYLNDCLQRRGDGAITILMLDLNGFKQINDRFGHMAGDRALKATADALRDACRPSSRRVFISRYGGDEFVLVAQGWNESELSVLKETIHRALEEAPHRSGEAFRLSASIGSASDVCSTFSDVEALLALADAAMYRQKGRINA